MKVVPERAPIWDCFAGVVLQAAGAQALALTAQPGAETITAGEFVIRYGVRFLSKPEQYIIPGAVVMDYGDLLTGEDAWNFLWHRSNLHPRSEVVGQREDNREDVVFFRSLDLSIPPQVLVYTSDTAKTPTAQPTAIIAADPAGIAPRLREFLPCYPTIEDWLLT